jgi:hypothetical protein
VVTPNPETLFISLAVLVGAWFLLLTMLWRRLIARHPAKYEAMNSPSFLSPVGLLPTLRFLFLREHRGLSDKALGITSDLALTILVLYITGFLLLASITGAFN